MHGVIFSELRRYVETRVDPSAWKKLLEEAQLPNRIYLATQVYPDAEAGAIVGAASRITGQPVPALLEDFGEFIAPSLLRIYRALIPPDWKTLDVIENAERTIHSVVRVRQPGASPPELRATRPSRNEVILSYSSARKMCGIAKGLARGIARELGERVTVRESQCMLEGAPTCEISIQRL
ncbi:MAG TPA: heme NO-binding domain-containing protein [Candidatus Eisenbacteria bacterium]|jgi:hypothetical protein